MDFSSPYRVAWHAPPPVNVHTASRSAVLGALEYEFPTTKRRIANRTGLGDTTVRRACRQLVREKVAALQYGRDPDNGNSCDLVTFARYPVLPVLEITDAYMVWRLCDTRGGSVFATVRDRGGFCTPEDDLTILMGRVSSILGAGTSGLPATVPLQAPVLLMDTHHPLPISLVRRAIDAEPAFVLTPEAAAANELRYHPATRDASAILYIRIGEACTASLLQRADLDQPDAPFRPSPWTSGLNLELIDRLKDLKPHTRAQWSRIAEFLADCCRFIFPHCVVLETDSPVTDVKLIRNALPSEVKLLCLDYALNSPSLAHKGALRLTRRALWESMESESPEA